MARKAKTKARAANKVSQVTEPRVKRSTVVTFTAEDLNVLAKVLAAGQVMVPTSHPVLWRLKAAMTRMGVVVPRGV
jgi:hypothetical protein